MVKQFIISAALLMLSLTGFLSAVHAQEAEEVTPVSINDQLVVTLDSLKKLHHEWHKILYKADAGTIKYTELTPYRKEWENYVNAHLNIVKNMKDTGSSIRLRGAVFNILKFHKQLINTIITPYEQIDVRATSVIKKNFTDKLKEEEKKEEPYIKTFFKEQKDFAQRNNINLTTEEEPQQEAGDKK
ncbi:MAG: hypothetical protein EBX41_08570 [Chitinophagia bacterium]|nr:hypothetical protein [Chitinophagia bacterium]